MSLKTRDLDAERSLLGALATDATRARATMNGTAGAVLFDMPRHRHVYDAIVALDDAGRFVDPGTIVAWLRDGGLLDACGGSPGVLDALHLDTAPPPEAAGQYADILADLGRQRRFLAAAAEARLAIERDGDADAAAAHLQAALAAERTSGHLPDWAALIVDGKTWLTSGPDTAQPLWGTPETILAALDQPTTIAGPQGAGKSVFGQRLSLGWLGLVPDILGLPVTPGDGNVLYLASDRPDQARLSMRRMVSDREFDLLEQRMRVWKGPPPEDVAKQPLMLQEMARVAAARLVVIDSVKDVALKLSADEVGAAYNSALQHCVADGVQIVALHHPRKLTGDNRGEVVVRTIDDLYGAYWITAGNGSVLYLQPGELDGYTLTQLKSPVGRKAELGYEHVHETGNVRPATAPTLDAILADAGYEGVSAPHAAKCLYGVAEPTGTQRKRVLRALNDMVDEGSAEAFTGSDKRKRWRAAE